MIEVKICGITREEDLKKAIELGFDAVGFILCESKRQITLPKVKSFLNLIPPFMSVVAVVKDPSIETLTEIVRAKVFTHVQFHGMEPPEMLVDFPLKRIKAIPIEGEESLNLTSVYFNVADYFLFDTKVGNSFGGTGKSFNWSILKKYDRSKPFILSGGINVNNLEMAIKELSPHGIDVNSSLEREPGVKDHKKMEEFMGLLRSLRGR